MYYFNLLSVKKFGKASSIFGLISVSTIRTRGSVSTLNDIMPQLIISIYLAFLAVVKHLTKWIELNYYYFFFHMLFYVPPG